MKKTEEKTGKACSMASSQTASTNGVRNDLLLSESSLNAPLLAIPGDSGEGNAVKLRSLSGPVYSPNRIDAFSDSSRFRDRPFSGGNLDSPKDEPFTIVNACFDESGTVVQAKTGFVSMRSTTVPGKYKSLTAGTHFIDNISGYVFYSLACIIIGFVPIVPYLRDQKRTKYEVSLALRHAYTYPIVCKTI